MIHYRYMFFLSSLFAIVFALIVFTPVIFILVNSVKTNIDITNNPLNLPVSFTFSHFSEAWEIMNFPWILFSTIFITCASTVGIVLIGSMTAYVLCRMKSKLKFLFYSFFIFSLLIPFPSIMFPLVRLASALGLNNTLGIIPLYWGLGTPIAVFVFHGFLRNIPDDFEAAATMEGAGFVHIFFSIALPLLKPALVTVMIITVFRTWNDFLLPLMLLPPGTTIQLALFSFFIQSSGSWGPALASLVLTSLPIVIFFLIIRKYMTKSVSIIFRKRIIL